MVDNLAAKTFERNEMVCSHCFESWGNIYVPSSCMLTGDISMIFYRTEPQVSWRPCSVEPLINAPAVKKQFTLWKRYIWSCSYIRSIWLPFLSIGTQWGRTESWDWLIPPQTGDNGGRDLPQDMFQVCTWRVSSDTFIVCLPGWSFVLQTPLCSSVHGERRLQACSSTYCTQKNRILILQHEYHASPWTCWDKIRCWRSCWWIKMLEWEEIFKFVCPKTSSVICHGWSYAFSFSYNIIGKETNQCLLYQMGT